MTSVSTGRLDIGAGTITHLPFGDLPYEGRMRDLLVPLHRGFNLVNRWLALPALRAGLGPLFSTPLAGSLMILRTTGRSSGLRREAPLGYVILDGAVYCCAGFGRQTAWYRNIGADPQVEVVLPTLAFAGVAETVDDEAEWGRVFPAYLRAIGWVGRATLGDLRAASPERLERLRTELPLVRIRPTGIAAGPADPGGMLWLIVQALSVLAFIRLLRSTARRVGAR
jgi:deazaflavin-dependent oxidoreductase (nitroreductase family)